MSQIVQACVMPTNNQYGDLEMVVITDDGWEGTAFVWFHDELTFQESEVIGMTVSQAQRFRLQRDVDYLKSLS